MATNIYLLTAEGWRVFGHHASPLPRTPLVGDMRTSSLH
jgi:hypothetical protein